MSGRGCVLKWDLVYIFLEVRRVVFRNKFFWGSRGFGSRGYGFFFSVVVFGGFGFFVSLGAKGFCGFVTIFSFFIS